METLHVPTPGLRSVVLRHHNGYWTLSLYLTDAGPALRAPQTDLVLSTPVQIWVPRRSESSTCPVTETRARGQSQRPQRAAVPQS
jgi:hypothetical protein